MSTQVDYSQQCELLRAVLGAVTALYALEVAHAAGFAVEVERAAGVDRSKV